MQSVFQVIPKLFSGVEVRALSRSIFGPLSCKFSATACFLDSWVTPMPGQQLVEDCDIVSGVMFRCPLGSWRDVQQPVNIFAYFKHCHSNTY